MVPRRSLLGLLAWPLIARGDTVATPDLPRSLTSAIADLAARVQRLEARPPLAGSGLSMDSSGVVNIAGSGGAKIPISQLAYGLGAAADASVITPAINGWRAGSLSVPVTITAGRMIVIVSAHIVAGAGGAGTPATAQMGYQIDGPTSVSPDRGRTVSVVYSGYGMDLRVGGSYAYVHTGLTPGAYTVTDQYYAESLGTPSNASSFDSRSLTVIPF